MRLNYTERTVFLLREHHCDMENKKLLFAWVFLGRLLGVFRLLHGCFKGTSRLFQVHFNVILESVMGVSRVFLGCFCPIEFALVAALTSVYKSNNLF